jgi:hypothetical protein
VQLGREDCISPERPCQGRAGPEGDDEANLGDPFDVDVAANVTRLSHAKE